MKKMTFLLAILLLNCTATAEIYKWVDKNGVTHYGSKKPLNKNSNNVSVLGKNGKTQKLSPKTQNSTKNVSDELFKKRFEKGLILGCMAEAEKVPQLHKYRSDFRTYCNCSARKIFETYSLNQLRDMQKETNKIKLIKLGMDSGKSCLYLLDNARRDLQK